MTSNSEDEQARCKASAPKKIVAAKLIIRSDKGNILLVKPTYKDGWQFPGGGVELEESPTAALVREIKEELDLKISEADLKSVGVAFQPKDDSVLLLYELRYVVSEQTDIRIQEDELESLQYVHPREVPAHVSGYYSQFWSEYSQLMV